MIFKECSNRTVYLIHQVDAFAHHTCMKCHLICACICRRMFPSIVFSLNGLEPTGFYDIYFEIVPASNYCFKFINNKWRAIGEAETEFKNTPYKHPESPRCGSEWMSKTISFQDVKLSNKHGEDNSIVRTLSLLLRPDIGILLAVNVQIIDLYGRWIRTVSPNPPFY